MPDALRTAVLWATLAQVVLVSALGTGLHDVFGCQHGHGECCSADCCSLATTTEVKPGCEDCAFCRHARRQQAAPTSNEAVADSTVESAGCDGCAVCDLLDEYQNVTPLELDPLAIELASDEAALQRQNRVIAAAIRLALSRGPPTVGTTSPS